MVAGSWMNNDGLYVQYGTQKAVPTTAGDYLSYGEWRDIEFTLNLGASPLSTAGTYIIANTTFLGTNIFLESVNVSVEVAAATGTSVSIGTRRLDRTTDISTTNILAATLTATLVAGYNNTTTTGGLVGTTITTSQFPDGSAYLTATTAGAFSAGTLKVRLRYRGIGTITQ
jgi:hypothetical protein